MSNGHRDEHQRPVWRAWAWGLAWALTAGACAAAAPAGGSSVVMNRLGHADDVQPVLHGPSFYLKGDGAPAPDSFALFASQVADTPVDVVVLGASYVDHEGECKLLVTLEQVHSCTTIVIRDLDGTDDPAVLAALRQAEIIYFRGGNQCNLVGWRDTPIHDAVVSLVARGGGTGGGSAGLAIQGALAVYDGCQGSARSKLALASPYGASISFTPSLFDWAPLGATLTDSHFVKRDRMGRLMAFLCRQLAGGKRDQVWGLGIDEGSTMVIDRGGLGTVFGDVAYMVHADQASSACESDHDPVTYLGFKVWRLPVGSTYDFTDRPEAGYYRIDVVEGVLSANPYAGPAVAAEASATAGQTLAGSPGL
jgi:cyanophycinase-like exopeptidase